MKRTTKDIIFLIVVSVMLFCAYQLGTTQAKAEAKETVKTVEVIPEGYISIKDCIPLEDITEEYKENYIDLRTVTGFKVNGNNLWIYTDDGNSYLIEK